MSASPRLSIASRVASSGTALSTSRLTPGLFRQYDSWIAGQCDSNIYVDYLALRDVDC